MNSREGNGQMNKLQQGDTIHCASRSDMIDIITALVSEGVEVRIVGRWVVKVEQVIETEEK